MAIGLKEFHIKLAQPLHNGEAVLDMVPGWSRLRSTRRSQPAGACLFSSRNGETPP